MDIRYYVRRNESGGGVCHDVSRLVTTLSTPKKMDALTIAAENAIINSGCCYYVYKNGIEIASFYVKEEN